MDVCLKDEVRTARKEYRCDAYAWWVECSMTANDCVNDEQRRVLAAAQAAKGRILPGTKYRYQRGPFEGQMSTWRAGVAMDGLCRELHLYED
jgi:hypothetical protein